MRIGLATVGTALLIGVMAASVHPQATRSSANDEQEIRRLIAVHAAASQKGDLQGLLSVYHADADVRYSDGTVLRGRAELEKSYREALMSDPKAVSHFHPAKSIRIRFLRPDVAFVDVDSVMGDSTEQAGANEPMTRTPLFVVFTKERGKWGVAIQRSGLPLK